MDPVTLLNDKSGVFINTVGDSIGDSALDLLDNGQRGILPRTTLKRDVSPSKLSPAGRALNHTSSHASIHQHNDISRDLILTQDQEEILNSMRRREEHGRRVDKSFDFGAKTEQQELMNNRAIAGVFSTLNDINYDRDSISKCLAPIHASVSATDGLKKVSISTQRRIETNRSKNETALNQSQHHESLHNEYD